MVQAGAVKVPTRAAAVLVALLLAAVPASAATGGTAETRTITIRAVEPKDDVFFAKGRVDPAYADRIALMQRKLKRESAWSTWKTWKKFRTDEESRYRRQIKPLNRVGTVCYRVKIKASGQYDASWSDKVCIRSRLA